MYKQLFYVNPLERYFYINKLNFEFVCSYHDRSYLLKVLQFMMFVALSFIFLSSSQFSGCICFDDIYLFFELMLPAYYSYLVHNLVNYDITCLILFVSSILNRFFSKANQDSVSPTKIHVLLWNMPFRRISM